MSVVASLLIEFGSGADESALVKLEPDAVMNVDAAGEEKTQFSPGDEFFFLLHFDPAKLRLGRMSATGGMIVPQGAVTRERSKEMLWDMLDDEHELDYLPASGLTAAWYWREGVGLKRTGQRTVVITGGELPVEGMISHQAGFTLYKLLTPVVELAENEQKKITITVTMEAAL